MANFLGHEVISGLGTFTLFTAPVAGNYFVDVKVSLPTLSMGGGVSAVVVKVKKNGSDVYTGTAGAEGFRIALALAAADAITINLASANAVDNARNAVKSTVAYGDGV